MKCGFLPEALAVAVFTAMTISSATAYYSGYPAAGTITQDEVGHGYHAIDIANSRGTDVGSCHHGRTDRRGCTSCSGYGLYMVMFHDNYYTSYYAHLDSFIAADNVNIARNVNIGNMGSTGNSTGPHVHFEIRKSNVRQYIPAVVRDWVNDNETIPKDYPGM